MPYGKSRKFENDIMRLLNQIGKLEKKLKSEGKVEIFPPIPINTEDSLRLFPLGLYLTNVNRNDIKGIENFIKAWKEAAIRGPIE